MALPPILVTGGTGTLGRQVAERLREAGWGPRPPWAGPGRNS
jgi:nucleoside-diphosphate-sugar epimerase